MWSPWQKAAWDGIDCKEVRAEGTAEAPHPLFLGLTRWGKSSQHKKLLARLMRQTHDWKTVRWGDVAWGGSLGLIDLAVDRNLPYLFKRCKRKGLLPTERTWRMALLHDASSPMIQLGLYFQPPVNLPAEHPYVQAMEVARQSTLLHRDTQGANGEGSSRRL